jgi:hypothetical protein
MKKPCLIRAFVYWLIAKRIVLLNCFVHFPSARYPFRKTTKSSPSNLTGSPPSGVTVISTSSIKQVSFSLYFQGNVLGSQV